MKKDKIFKKLQYLKMSYDVEQERNNTYGLINEHHKAQYDVAETQAQLATTREQLDVQIESGLASGAVTATAAGAKRSCAEFVRAAFMRCKSEAAVDLLPISSPDNLSVGPGVLLALAAATNTGKSTFLRQIAVENALCGNTVVYIKFEEGESEVLTYLHKLAETYGVANSRELIFNNIIIINAMDAAWKLNTPKLFATNVTKYFSYALAHLVIIDTIDAAFDTRDPNKSEYESVKLHEQMNLLAADWNTAVTQPICTWPPIVMAKQMKCTLEHSAKHDAVLRAPSHFARATTFVAKCTDVLYFDFEPDKKTNSVEYFLGIPKLRAPARPWKKPDGTEIVPRDALWYTYCRSTCRVHFRNALSLANVSDAMDQMDQMDQSAKA